MERFTAASQGRFLSLAAAPFRLVRVIRRDGAGVAWRKARIRLNRAIGMSRTVRLSPEQREKLDEARTVRAFRAVQEVLAGFEDEMRSGPFRSAPLTLIRKIFDARSIGDGRLDTVLERCLGELTEQLPSCSEAWLELAFLHQDSGRRDAAMACFKRASEGVRSADAPIRQPHPVAIAAAELGRLLAAAGHDAEAAKALARAYDYDPNQKMVAVEYAHIMRRLGRLDQALTYYGEGMYYQESRWSLPHLPRDATALRFPQLARRLAELPPEPAAAAPRPEPVAALEDNRMRN
jgi:tetratricopeptide (TPR) repeat protein